MKYIGPRKWVLVHDNTPFGVFEDAQTAMAYAKDKLGASINWDGYTNYLFTGVDGNNKAWTLKNTPIYTADDL